MKNGKKTAPQKPETEPVRRWRISAWNLLFLVLGMALVVPFTPLGTSLFGLKATPPGGMAPADYPTNRWGWLEITPMVLERPSEYFADDPPPPPKILWFFKGYTAERLLDLLTKSGLDDHNLSALTDTNIWQIAPQGVVLEPPLELVRDLQPAARERLYRVLAEFPQNVTQRYPYVYRKSGFDEWFATCGLPAQAIEQVKKMTYMREGRLLFSDGQYFQLTLPSNEVRCLARTLSRVPTLLMNLRVTPGADRETLMSYWGNPERNRSLQPLLESMARVPAGSSINVTYFFPPVPQQLIYTYPSPTNALNARQPDCFWSSMNFANQAPDMRYLDSEHIKRVLASDYHRVAAADSFGDVILFYEGGELWKAIHMCVYIAEDVVFTKNGADLFQPWVLMRMDDMLINYPNEKPLQKAVYRRIRR